MKSVIFLFYFVCVSLTSMAQKIEIVGPTKVSPGDNYIYNIYLTGTLQKDVELTLTCSEEGEFSKNRNDTVSQITLKASNLQQITPFYVNWKNKSTTKARLRAFDYRNPKMNAVLENITILESSGTDKLDEMTIVGNPSFIMKDEIFTVNIKYLVREDFEIKSVKWSDNVEELSHSSKYKEVKLKFVKSGTQSLIAEIYHAWDRYPKDATYVAHQKIDVIPNKIEGNVNLNNKEIYSLDAIPIGYSLNWSVSNNLQLISGQGTSQIVVEPKSSTPNPDKPEPNRIAILSFFSFRTLAFTS